MSSTSTFEQRLRGRALKLGHNIDTEQILATRHSAVVKPDALLPHLLEDADPAFRSRMKKGDIIVAGSNFGCGGSNDIAALVFKWAGISAVVAESFARIFYRNAINIGLPVLEAPGAYPGIAEGDMVEVDLEHGLVRSITRMRTLHATPYTDLMQTILRCGGLEEYVRLRLKKRAPA